MTRVVSGERVKLKHLIKRCFIFKNERKLSEIVSNLRKFHLLNGGKRGAVMKLIALQSENFPKMIKRSERNFSITISLVLIFIARNIKTNDFHFIFGCFSGRSNAGWRKG